MWRPLQRTDLGFLGTLDAVLRRAQDRDPHAFPDLQRSEDIIVTSDYGGENKEALYAGYSFLINSAQSWAEWEPHRLALRRTLRFERRLSFKKLADGQRREALPAFLNAAGSLDGLSLTFLVDKRIPSLFDESGTLDLFQPDLNRFRHWKPRILERVLRVTHLLALLLAGLTREGQNILWFTDEDAIAANSMRLTELTNILVAATSAVLPHNLGHLRCGTTASDNGSQQIEDLAAIPDLAVGSLVELVSRYDTEASLPSSQLVAPAPRSVSGKARRLMDWFSDPQIPLRRQVLAVVPAEDGVGLTVKRLRFHGTAGSVG